MAAARIGEEAAQQELSRLQQEGADIRAAFDLASSDLRAATDAYAATLAHHLNMYAQIARLRIHVSQNVLHYMQAIWESEPPDQRYFRLYNVTVPEVDPIAGASDSQVQCRRDFITGRICETTLPPPGGFAPQIAGGRWERSPTLAVRPAIKETT